MKNSVGVLTLSQRSVWRQAALALIVLWLAILLLFRETASSIVSIWINNGTYTHGFIVFPISIWLVWKKHDILVHYCPEPFFPAFLFLTISCFLWLIGQLAEVNVVPQFALVFMLISSVVAVFGLQISKIIIFPLFFLLLAVPFGEFTQYKLMEWTANFTVLGLRLTGVPVYSEGHQIVIPTGTWSVVEACSGVRYLIASVTVGTLYAYLTYKSLKRRLIFIGLSFLVPIAANWARAYIIVMLGHLSGNKLAVGVDHLIYGWVFFGLVIGLMFWIGARWHDNNPDMPVVVNEQFPEFFDKKISLGSLIFSGLLILSLWPIAFWQLQIDRIQISKIASLAPISGWKVIDHALPTWTPKYENYSASQHWILENNQNFIGLFVAAYRNQNKDRRLVSSINKLVVSGDPVWSKVSSGRSHIQFNSRDLEVHTAELRSVSENRLLVWQWYWVNGLWTSSDFMAKLYTAYSRIIGQGDDSAVVIVYTFKKTSEATSSILEDFVIIAAPEIEKTIEQTMRIE